MDHSMESNWTSLDMPIIVQTNGTGFNLSMLGPQRDSLYIVIPITIIYAIIFFTGVLGNVSTCIVIARNKSMHTATNYYLFSLAVSDLLLLVTGLPQEMYSIWSRYPYVFGEVFCVLRGLASETSANATVLTITAFTVERYVAICHPFLSHTMSKLSRAVKLILAVWVIAFSFAVPQALQFGIVNSGTVVCMVNKVIIQHSFELSTFLFFVAPMTLITVLYALIGLRLRTSNMMKKSTGNSGNTSQKSCRHQHGQSSRRVLKMLVAVVVAFFICWAPFHAQRLVAIYETSFKAAPPYKLKLYEIITYVSGILYYVSTTVNPILYHIMSNKFREAFKETFSRCCWCGNVVRSGRGTRLSDRRSCYSILSRSGAGATAVRVSEGADAIGSVCKHVAPESTDSGTYSHRHSEESMCLHPVAVMHGTPRQALFIHNDSQDEHTIEFTSNNKDIDLNPVVALNKLNVLQANEIHTSPRKRPSRSTRFLQIFQCITKKTFDDKKHSTPNELPINETQETIEETVNNTTNTNESIHMSTYNVRNNSLRDIDNDAIEDELTIYMKEIQRREKDNS